MGRVVRAVRRRRQPRVATGVSTYFDAGGKPDRVYDNVFVMEFDKDGRCASFIEWFRQRPGPGA